MGWVGGFAWPGEEVAVEHCDVSLGVGDYVEAPYVVVPGLAREGLAWNETNAI